MEVLLTIGGSETLKRPQISEIYENKFYITIFYVCFIYPLAFYTSYGSPLKR